ncbi:MAG: acyl-CoA dehydrogenase family protein [Hyphomonadaceae bacterium]
MPFDSSSEQRLLRDTLQSFLADAYDMDARRRITQSVHGWSPDIWKRLATDLGILGLGFSADWGGLDGDGLDQIPVMEAFGQSLVIEPYLETVILCGSLLQTSGTAAARALAGEIMAGEARLALAHLEGGAFRPYQIETRAERRGKDNWRLTGRKSVVIGGAWATHLLVVARLDGSRLDRSGLGIFVVEAERPGVEHVAYPTIDGRRACDLQLDVELPAAALLLGDATPEALDLALDRAVAGLCAEAVGVMRRLLGETHAYISERRQFGAPLATFQALQHRMADMLVALELSSGHAYQAANVLTAPTPQRASAVSAAKVFIGRAAHRVGQAAVQLHGGMGMTDELLIGHLFKRAIAIEGQFGSSDYHLQRFQTLQDKARRAFH